ncbi:M56 family metallopeptidase [Oscillospiraceae bacterium MB08-C2-2]|nr:M56 family metallopeptidase [Oscillospiraceae bacterium MB08-C2-2]
MNEFLKVFLSLSFSGTLLILILLLCKPLFRKKLSKSWQYYIWLIVIVRLLLPLTPDTSLVGNFFQKIDSAPAPTVFVPSEDLQQKTPSGDITISSDVANETQSVPTARPSGNVLQIVPQKLWLIWIIVAVALLMRKITVYQSFVNYLRAGQTELTDMEKWEQFGKLVAQSGVKAPVNIYTNSLISSPLLIGFFRPCIMLPTAELSKSDFEYTVLHELTHFKRRDLFYKWLVQLTICLHWFNPFVYLMSREINCACELSCDEAVVRSLDKDGRRAYGDTLLNAIGIGGSYKNAIASMTLTESKKLLQERLDSIMTFKKKSKIAVCASVFLAAFLLCGSAFAGAYTAKGDANGSVKKLLENTGRLSGGEIPKSAEKIEISCDINNGGVDILPASNNKIEVSYDDKYYDVSITRKADKWLVRVSGKVAMMGTTDDVKLYLPNIKRVMDINVNNGNLSYDLPENSMDIISVTALNAGLNFTSANKYANSAISLTATDKDFLKYELPVYPSYFTKTDSGFQYENGTKVNQIGIKLTGYTGVNFAEHPASANEGAVKKKTDDNDNYAKRDSNRTFTYNDSLAHLLEYAQWGIKESDGIFYYNNVRIRIFIDKRADGSFENAFMDDDGKIDIRLIRDKGGKIIRVGKISKEEAAEFSSDFDDTFQFGEEMNKIGAEFEFEFGNKINRLEKDEIPTKVQEAIRTSCTGTDFFIIKGNDRQYLYYNNLSTGYAYEIKDKTVNIVSMRNLKKATVLLEFPADWNLSVQYNSKAVTCYTVQI